MAAPVLLTHFPDQAPDFLGDLVVLGAATVNGAPSGGAAGVPFLQHTVALTQAKIAAAATPGDTATVRVWYYRKTIDQWFADINIGDVVLIASDPIWDAIDRRVPCVVADRVYLQVVAVSNVRVLPYISSAAYGWTERIG